MEQVTYKYPLGLALLTCEKQIIIPFHSNHSQMPVSLRPSLLKGRHSCFYEVTPGLGAWHSSSFTSGPFLPVLPHHCSGPSRAFQANTEGMCSIFPSPPLLPPVLALPPEASALLPPSPPQKTPGTGKTFARLRKLYFDVTF